MPVTLTLSFSISPPIREEGGGTGGNVWIVSYISSCFFFDDSRKSLILRRAQEITRVQVSTFPRSHVKLRGLSVHFTASTPDRSSERRRRRRHRHRRRHAPRAGRGLTGMRSHQGALNLALTLGVSDRCRRQTKRCRSDEDELKQKAAAVSL